MSSGESLCTKDFIENSIPYSSFASSSCRVHGAMYMVQGVWCKVYGARCRVQGAGCKVQGARCKVQGAGHREKKDGFRAMVMGTKFDTKFSLV